MSETQRVGEKGSPRFVWILPLVAGVLWAFQGLLRAAMGCTISNCFGDQLPASTPQAVMGQLADFAQEIGTFNVLIGVLIIATSLVGLRKGHRWAAYVILWFFAVGIADVGELGNPLYLLGIILAGLGLLLSYRILLPEKRVK